MIYYEDVLKALNKCKADYVVFGGMAAILYGVPRTTMDIDIMIDLTSKGLYPERSESFFGIFQVITRSHKRRKLADAAALRHRTFGARPFRGQDTQAG